ncbi:MAG: phosphatase PAP2 family protein [Actinomycetaceae bacterium]|nr:phosphatase PAP2 family protein [Actinomycetaceae bacterium]
MSSAPSTPPAVPARRWVRIFLALANLGAFIALALMSLYRAFGQTLDQFAFDVIASHTRIAALTDWVGVERHSMLVLVAGTLVAMAVAAARKRFALAARVGVMVVGANITTQILKNWVLHRPYLGVGYDLPNSFPSGHGTVLLSLAFAFTVVTTQRHRSWVAVVLALVAALGSILIVASGWHRPSDLLGSLMVVMVWVLTLCPQEVPTRPRDNWQTFSLSISAAVVLLLAALAWGALPSLDMVSVSYLQGNSYPAVAGRYPRLVTATAVIVPIFLTAIYLLCLQIVATLQSGWRGRR